MAENFAHLGGLNAYEILGVESTATTEQIEAAYRAAIKRQHSDTGGVTRLAQLVNDARDALIKHRTSYDAWLRDPARQRTDAAPPDAGPGASASDPWQPTSQPTGAGEDAWHDRFWDPWESADWESADRKPPPEEQSAPRSPPDSTSDPDQAEAAFFAERRDAQSEPAEPLSSRSILAIVIGGMSVLCLVTLAIAVLLGMFSDPPKPNPSANPIVTKQGQVVFKPGTRAVLDSEGTSFAPSDDHASLVGTDSGIRLDSGTSHVALTPPAPERYDTCSALNYPEETGKTIPWNELTVGSMQCLRTASSDTTTSLIKVVDRTGSSATLEITTWND
jgi:hypothetical protein